MISVSVPQARVYLKTMHPDFTMGRLTLVVMHSHVPDGYEFAGGTDNEYAYFKLKVPASEAHRLLEVLQGDLSRFKGDICISHDVDMPEPQVDNSQQQDDERHCAERLALTERD
jgi:hypothetical protein